MFKRKRKSKRDFVVCAWLMTGWRSKTVRLCHPVHIQQQLLGVCCCCAMQLVLGFTALLSYSATNLVLPKQIIKWGKKIWKIYRKFGNLGPMQFIWNLNFCNTVNKLYFRVGARMARIFMDLLRESDSTNFAKPFQTQDDIAWQTFFVVLCWRKILTLAAADGETH